MHTVGAGNISFYSRLQCVVCIAFLQNKRINSDSITTTKNKNTKLPAWLYLFFLFPYSINYPPPDTRSSQFTRAIRKIASAMLSAASQLLFAHMLALPSNIPAGRLSCKHAACPQKYSSELLCILYKISEEMHRHYFQGVYNGGAELFLSKGSLKYGRGDSQDIRQLI